MTVYEQVRNFSKKIEWNTTTYRISTLHRWYERLTHQYRLRLGSRVFVLMIFKRVHETKSDAEHNINLNPPDLVQPPITDADVAKAVGEVKPVLKYQS